MHLLSFKYSCTDPFIGRRKKKKDMNQDTNQEELLCFVREDSVLLHKIISVTVMVVNIMVIYLKTALGLITKVTSLGLYWFFILLYYV